MKKDKELVISRIEADKQELFDLSDTIFDLNEVGCSEFKSSALVMDAYEKLGFTVERGVGTLPTAFRATYQSGEGGPVIGFLCEYDALPNFGHACAHNQQSPAILGVCKGLLELSGKYNFKLVVYGCPDEECTVRGGKVVMAENGCFRDMDVCLTMHAGPHTCPDPRTLAMNKFDVTFHGYSAAAGTKADEGRSALDALILACKGMEFLREHVSDEAVIQYKIIGCGDTPANVVPDIAQATFGLRAPRDPYLQKMVKRFRKIMQAAADMTETTVDVELKTAYLPKFPNDPLVKLMYENMHEMGVPDISPLREKYGSGDGGNVMQFCPGLTSRFLFVEGVSAHTEKWLEEGKSELAHNCVMYGAKSIAGVAVDLITVPENMQAVRDDYVIQLADIMRAE